MGGDALCVLVEARQLAGIFRIMAQLGQAVAHDPFGQELRHEQGYMIRLGRCGFALFDDNRVLETAIVPILTLHRIGAADRNPGIVRI